MSAESTFKFPERMIKLHQDMVSKSQADVAMHLRKVIEGAQIALELLGKGKTPSFSLENGNAVVKALVELNDRQDLLTEMKKFT